MAKHVRNFYKYDDPYVNDITVSADGTVLTYKDKIKKADCAKIADLLMRSSVFSVSASFSLMLYMNDERAGYQYLSGLIDKYDESIRGYVTFKCFETYDCNTGIATLAYDSDGRRSVDWNSEVSDMLDTEEFIAGDFMISSGTDSDDPDERANERIFAAVKGFIGKYVGDSDHGFGKAVDRVHNEYGCVIADDGMMIRSEKLDELFADLRSLCALAKEEGVPFGTEASFISTYAPFRAFDIEGDENGLNVYCAAL